MTETLQHYGILGMKWGVRRTPEQLGHAPSRKELRRAAKEQRQKEQQKASDLYRKTVAELYSEYGDLEKKYKDAERAYNRGDYDKAEKLQNEADRISAEISRRARKAVDKQYPGVLAQKEAADRATGYAVLAGGLVATIAIPIAVKAGTSALVKAGQKIVRNIIP